METKEILKLTDLMSKAGEEAGKASTADDAVAVIKHLNDALEASLTANRIMFNELLKIYDDGNNRKN